MSSSLAVCLLVFLQVKEPPAAPPLVELFRSTSRPVYSLDFHPTAPKLAIGGNGVALMIDLATRKAELEMSQAGVVHGILFRRDGKLLVTRSEGPDALLRPLPDADPAKFQVVHSPSFLSDVGLMKSRHGSPTLIFAPDRKRLVMGDGGRGVRIWSLAGLDQAPRKVSELAFDFVDTRILTDEEKRLGKAVHAITIGRVTALAMDSMVLWIGLEDGYLLPVPAALLDSRFATAKGHTVEERTEFQKPLDSLPSSPSLPTSDPRKMQARVFHSVQAAKVFRPHLGDINAVGLYSPSSDVIERAGLVLPADAPLPDDLRLITAGADGRVRVWRNVSPLMSPPDLTRNNGPKAAEVKPEAELKGSTFVISPDRKKIAIAEIGGVRLYSFPKLEPLSWTPTERKLGRAARLRFSPDSKMLAAAMCACSDCSGGSNETLQLTPRLGRPDHGGALVVWELPEPKK